MSHDLYEGKKPGIVLAVQDFLLLSGKGKNSGNYIEETWDESVRSWIYARFKVSDKNGL